MYDETTRGVSVLSSFTHMYSISYFDSLLCCRQL